tara:strand:+ start:888 stop:1370 length:483 start_codon:yes stop_codon:yes gene_type:complete
MHNVPSGYMFGWNISETKRTLGAEAGYESENVKRKENMPPSQGESCGPQIVADQTNKLSSECGDAEQPCVVSRKEVQRVSETRIKRRTKHERKRLSDNNEINISRIYTSGGSIRIERKSDCNLKHADAELGLDPRMDTCGCEDIEGELDATIRLPLMSLF